MIETVIPNCPICLTANQVFKMNSIKDYDKITYLREYRKKTFYCNKC